MYDYLILVVGLGLLLVGGDFLVRGAVGLASRLGIPPLIIGLTVISFGTSAPELFISVDAALNGAGGMAVGNVVGSNIANILLVMGLPAMLKATPCHGEGIGKNVLVMLGTTLVFMGMLLNGHLERFDGLILCALIGLFIYDQFQAAKAHRNEPIDEETAEEIQNSAKTPAKIALFLALGLIGLPVGAELTVTSATGIAQSWGVSDAVIGLTVVALGTSLPELAASLMAVMRNSSSVAIGNIVGSNLFNLTAVMGPAVLIQPIAFNDHIIKFDMWIMLAVTLLLAFFAKMNMTVGFKTGLAMVSAYVIYIVSAFLI